MGRDTPGLRHEIKRGREQSDREAYTQDKSIRSLGLDIPWLHLLTRREKCTRVYTIVYPCVHYCIHACTQLRSKYVPFRVLSYGHSP